MKINKIKLYNFNSYEGENEFDFVNQDQSKNIVLIGGKMVQEKPRYLRQ